jgi:hypothetical protein
MHRPEIRDKVSATLRQMGWKPKVQGGNGHGPTWHEQALATAIGWDLSVIVPTRQPRGSGYPTHYKIDVGHRGLRVGIEVDGMSHVLRTRQAQDRKKEAFLATRGWHILRFTNAEIARDLTRCVQAVWSTISKSPLTTTTSPQAS